MTSRKTYSLPDEVAAAVAREARRQGRPESAVVRDALGEYFTGKRTSQLDAWVGGGSSRQPPVDDVHTELVKVLEEKHPGSTSAAVR